MLQAYSVGMTDTQKLLPFQSELLVWLSQLAEDLTHKGTLKWTIQSSSQVKDKFLKHLTLNQINVMVQ